MSKRRMFAVLLCLCGIVCLLCGCDSADYKKANTLLEKGDFAEARQIYQRLKDKEGYEDCAGKLLECDRVEADASCEAGDYERAGELYQKLAMEDTYWETACEGLRKVAYGQGTQYMESGDYVSAVTSFSAAGEYEDSGALIGECAAALMEDPQAGDSVFFGTYAMNRDETNSPKPIQWRVLARNGDRLLLLGEYILEYCQFGSNGYWDQCELRQWLNGDFYENAFTTSEKAAIQKMLTSDITEDNVFLLSREEAAGLLPEPEDRIAYNHMRGVETEWWLRSQDTGEAAGRCYGQVTPGGEFWYMESLMLSKKESFHGVRPVICVSLSGKTEDAAQNMSLFGYDSDVGFGTRNRDLDRNYTLRGNRTGSAAGGTSSSGSCPACGGTGAIRYNYGSSDLEAWLTGNDAYTLDTCPMCGGSGRVG